MSIFIDPVLVTLTDSDPFITIQTYDPKHGRSQRFYLLKEPLLDLINDGIGIIDKDLMNFCCASRFGHNIRFTMFWLRENCGELQGYQNTLSVPAKTVLSALSGETIRHLSYSLSPTLEKAQLSISPTASKAISEAQNDVLKRHALRRFFRDNFCYGRDEKLVIQEDSWVHGFYFVSTVNSTEGGIVLHESTVIGKDGKPHRKVYYCVHT